MTSATAEAPAPITTADRKRAGYFGLKLPEMPTPEPDPTSTPDPSPESDRTPRCRLTVTIAGRDYRVRPLVNEAFAGHGRAWRLRKLDGSGIIYDLAETVHGAVCDCADFVYRREGLDPKGCKQVRAMKALGLIG